MRKWVGPCTRIVVFALAVVIQIGFIQATSVGAHPWVNLPLVLLLWNALQKNTPWPLVVGGVIGMFLDLSTNHAFGIFVLAHTLAALTVMVISVEWLHRRGTGNRVVIALTGLFVYGFIWWIFERQSIQPPNFFTWDLLIEVGLIWISFSVFRLIRPLWLALTRPVQRYA